MSFPCIHEPMLGKTERNGTVVVGNSCESLHVLIKHCVSLATNGGTQLLHKLAP